MIRDEARDLREIRDALREYEGSQLAEIAETLARAAESLARVTAELDRNGEWLTPEQAAEYLGISESQFKAIGKQIPRRYVSERVIRYRKEYLDEWLDERDELRFG